MRWVRGQNSRGGGGTKGQPAALVLRRPNGAGKSTLLHLLTQQLQPTSGEAWLNRGAKWAIFAQHHIDQLDLSRSGQP